MEKIIEKVKDQMRNEINEKNLILEFKVNFINLLKNELKEFDIDIKVWDKNIDNFTIYNNSTTLPTSIVEELMCKPFTLFEFKTSDKRKCEINESSYSFNINSKENSGIKLNINISQNIRLNNNKDMEFLIKDLIMELNNNWNFIKI